MSKYFLESIQQWCIEIIRRLLSLSFIDHISQELNSTQNGTNASEAAAHKACVEEDNDNDHVCENCLGLSDFSAVVIGAADKNSAIDHPSEHEKPHQAFQTAKNSHKSES